LPALKIGEDGFENVQPGLAGPQAIFPPKSADQAGLFFHIKAILPAPTLASAAATPYIKAGNPFSRHSPRNIDPL